MKRHLCAAALLAAALIPDWASACGRRQSSRVYYAPPRCEPVYSAPVVCCPQTYPQPVFVVPGTVPMQMQPPMQPPRVVPGKGKSDSSITPPATPNVARPQPAPAPEVGFAKPQATPELAPEPRRVPVNDDSKIPPIILPTEFTKPEGPKIPSLTTPKSDEKPPLVLPIPELKNEPKNEPLKPALEIPKPTPEPNLPPITLPKPGGNSKVPPLESPGANAIPVPAPAPDVLVPPIPLPKNPDSLPPLTLPPDAPITPVAPVNDKEKDKTPKPVEAKSSPLSGAARELKVTVFPATGTVAATAVAPGLRKVGFYNHTKRDLTLVIEGKSVTLPAMSYLHAQLPPTFSWKHGDNPSAKETVPADAAGVDVVIRE